LGIKSGSTALATARNYDMSDPLAEADDASKIKQDNLTIICATSTEQMCARMFSMESRTLKNKGKKSVPDWWCHHLKMSHNPAPSGGAARRG
jgi:hypothetical protein